MEITILTIGKTTTSYVKEGIDEYLRRLKRYAPIKYIELPDVRKGKNISAAEQKQKEGKLILSSIQASDIVVLLDERGSQLSSEQFALWMDKKMGTGRKRLVFIIGGPYGFSQEVYDKANEMVSLSSMTFNHEMVRLFLSEQLYRGFSILNNEPYHHA